MARDRNTYAKRQRETGKRQKAEEKRARRRKRKELATGPGDAGRAEGPAIDAGPGDPLES
jgi:hypothetical protein